MKEYKCELYTLLDRFSELIRPVSYLEVGVCEGGSLKRLIKHGCPARLYLCDDWGSSAGGSGRGSHEHIQVMLDGFGVTVQPVYLDGSSHDLIKDISVTFQMITVDGDHSAEGAVQDLHDCWRLLEVNGFLFFDDIYHPQHMYLDGELTRFVSETADARLICRHVYGEDYPGCAVIQKIIT